MAKGVLISEDIFQLLIDGVLNEHQYCEFMRLIYFRSFKDKDWKKEEELDPLVKHLWNLAKSKFKQNINGNKKETKKKKEAKANVVKQYYTKSYQETLEKNAKKMREEPTKAEMLVNGVLRGTIGKDRFKCQHIILGKSHKGYIADFYFPNTRTILEVDGEYHSDKEQKKKDDMRTKDLEDEGYKVFRISNDDVYKGKISPEIASEIVKNDIHIKEEKLNDYIEAFIYCFSLIHSDENCIKSFSLEINK